MDDFIKTFQINRTADKKLSDKLNYQYLKTIIRNLSPLLYYFAKVRVANP